MRWIIETVVRAIAFFSVSRLGEMPAAITAKHAARARCQVDYSEYHVRNGLQYQTSVALPLAICSIGTVR